MNKSVEIIDLSGTNPVSLLTLQFENGAITQAITTTTACTFSQGQRRFHCNGVVDTSESVLENTKDFVANMNSHENADPKDKASLVEFCYGGNHGEYLALNG